MKTSPYLLSASGLKTSNLGESSFLAIRSDPHKSPSSPGFCVLREPPAKYSVKSAQECVHSRYWRSGRWVYKSLPILGVNTISDMEELCIDDLGR